MGRTLRLTLLMIALGCAVGCGGGGSTSNNTGGPAQMLGTLNGQYALVMTGFDATGQPMAIAGSLTADGQGHITAATVDVNDNFANSSGTSLTGTYTLDTTLRGVITLATAFGSIPHPLAFAFTLKTNGTAGDIMTLDSNPFTAGGTMQQQTSSAFSAAALAADYSFELDSNAGTRQSTIGRFTLSSSGTTSNTLLDTAIAGTGLSTGTSGSMFSATFVAPSSANGRGTLTMSIGQGAQMSYVYYVIAAGKIFIMETDASNVSSTIRAGVADKQNGPFTTTSVNTSGAVFALAGIDSGKDISAIGNMAITTQTSASLAWDTNDNGTFFTAKTATNQAVTFDPSTGRGTITVLNGVSLGLLNSAVFYLTASGQGFLLDSSLGTSNRALAGPLEAQSGVGTFATSTLSANMIVRATANSTSDSGAVVGIFVPTSGAFTFTFDRRSVGQADGLNLVSTGDSISSINATTGRGMLNLGGTTGVGSQTTEIVYVIAPNQFVFVDQTPTPANSTSPPPPTPLIFYFDPQ